MAIFRLTPEKLLPLERTTFAANNIWERRDLQDLIANQFSIIDEDVLVIAQEFNSFAGSSRSIDILGIDRSANLVVVELKRDDRGGHMELQAIRYAAMISTMRYDDTVHTYANYLERRGEDGGEAEARMLDHLGLAEPDKDDFNSDPRIVLVSANFDKEITTSALWLNERGVDVHCVRLQPHLDGEAIYLDIQQVVPLPEAEEFLVGVAQKRAEERAARREERTWEGDWYVNVGMHENDETPGQRNDGRPDIRHWEFCRKHGFLVAGGGKRYSRPLRKLKVGDHLYAYQRGAGYLGRGVVNAEAKPAHLLKLADGRTPIEATGVSGINADLDRPEDNLEWAVGIDWKATVPLDDARLLGSFANQNVVCKLRHAETLKALRDEFGEREEGGD